MHYKRWQLYGDPFTDRTVHREEMPCAVDGCDEPHIAKGFCAMHWRRWKKHGDPTKGAAVYTRRLDEQQGYVLLRVPEHPNATKTGYVFEHRYVMAEHLGRPLAENEVVHHKNGVRNDNRLENLELMDRSAHARLRRASTHCPHCGKSLSVRSI